MPRSAIDGSPPDNANIEFPPYGLDGGTPTANYRNYGLDGDGTTALRLSDLSRTYALAQRLKSRTTTPYEYALAVNDYLREGFEYTEKPPAAPPGAEPLESFLLDTKAGYCQHFSAGMALLLRMGGIPARVATGFSPGGYSKRKQAWIVRDTDAHSWVEAWFDDFGWVTMDPTPSETPARSQIATLSAPATPEDSAGNPTGDPNAGGDSPADRRAAGSREELFNQLRGGGVTATEDGGAADGSGLPLWPLIPIALVLSAGGALWLTRRRRGAPGRPARPGDLRARDRAAALRPPDAGGHDAAPARGRLGLSGDAAGYLRAVSAGRYGPGGTMPTPSSAGPCAASSPPAWASPAACGPGGRCRLGRLHPLDELDDDAARVGDLEVALAPRLRLERGRDLDALRHEPVVLGVDVVDHEGHQQPVGAVAGERRRLERLQARPQVDQVEAGVGPRERHEPVGGHLALEPEVLGGERGRGLRVVDVERDGGGGDLHSVHCTE